VGARQRSRRFLPRLSVPASAHWSCSRLAGALCGKIKSNQMRQEMVNTFNTPGIHHIGLRCSNLERAKAFYSTILGFKIIREEPIFVFLAGSTVVAMKGPEADSPNDDVFNPFRIGLDHIALACDKYCLGL
jgi:catechol-2,3-dioxygenase